jgi:hypothetical protein
MGDTDNHYGYGQAKWDRAKEALRKKLWDMARQEDWMTYGEAAAEISHIIAFDPHDQIFHHMLGQITVEEDAAGRGMLSALVVHKDGDKFPGTGFFDLASRLGRDANDHEACWVKEITRLFQEAGRVPA